MNVYLVFLRVDAGPEEGGFPAVHVFLGVTGQLNLTEIFIDIPARKRHRVRTQTGHAGLGSLALPQHTAAKIQPARQCHVLLQLAWEAKHYKEGHYSCKSSSHKARNLFRKSM